MPATADNLAITNTSVAPQIPDTPPPMLLPHMQQFQAVWKTPARTYRWTFDEALKRSRTDAMAMRRDGHILSLLQARYLPLLGAEWGVKSDEEAEKETAGIYQKLIEKTPRFLQMRKCLLDAIWFGRYGVQLAFGKQRVGEREMIGVTAWKPVNGDKIAFREDGTPCIRINPAFANELNQQGATIAGPEGGNKWTAWSDQGTVLVLDKPSFRQRFIIHIHEIEDADFTEPELAGGVGGVGLRHYCYWIWWLRQELMEWLLSYLELVGAGGFTLVGYDGSDAGLQKAQEAFAERATVVFLPRPPGQDQQTSMVERVEPSGTGNEIFKEWIEGYFNSIITRIIIGQDLSSQSGSTGLGSGVADLQADVKQCIHIYDAKNINETETQQLLETLIQLNEPGKFYSLKCVSTLKSPDAEKDMAAAQTAYNLGVEMPESFIRKLANIPEPMEGERVIGQAQQQAQSAELAMMQGMPGENQGDVGGGWNNAEG